MLTKRPSKLTVTRHKSILGFRSGRCLGFWPVPRSSCPIGPLGSKSSQHRWTPRASLERIRRWLGSSFCFTSEPALCHGAPHKCEKGNGSQESELLAQALSVRVALQHSDNKPRLSRRGRTCTGKSRRRSSWGSASSPSVRTPPCAHHLLSAAKRGQARREQLKRFKDSHLKAKFRIWT